MKLHDQSVPDAVNGKEIEQAALLLQASLRKALSGPRFHGNVSIECSISDGQIVNVRATTAESFKLAKRPERVAA